MKWQATGFFAVPPCGSFVAPPLAKDGAICYDIEKEGTTARRLPLHFGETVKEITVNLCPRGGYFFFMAMMYPVASTKKSNTSNKVIMHHLPSLAEIEVKK